MISFGSRLRPGAFFCGYLRVEAVWRGGGAVSDQRLPKYHYTVGGVVALCRLVTAGGHRRIANFVHSVGLFLACYGLPRARGHRRITSFSHSVGGPQLIPGPRQPRTPTNSNFLKFKRGLRIFAKSPFDSLLPLNRFVLHPSQVTAPKISSSTRRLSSRSAFLR